MNTKPTKCKHCSGTYLQWSPYEEAWVCEQCGDRHYLYTPDPTIHADIEDYDGIKPAKWPRPMITYTCPDCGKSREATQDKTIKGNIRCCRKCARKRVQLAKTVPSGVK